MNKTVAKTLYNALRYPCICMSISIKLIIFLLSYIPKFLRLSCMAWGVFIANRTKKQS